MSDGFLKLNRKAAEYLIEHEPECYLLITQIALRARRIKKVLNSLDKRQALIGDSEKCGLTRQKYRTALKKLETMKIITIKSTTKGSIVTLLDNRIYDINVEDEQPTDSPSSNQQATIEQPLKKNEEVRIKKKKINTLVEYSESFLKFYEVYPRKNGKQEAFESWLALNPDAELTEKIVSAVSYQLKTNMFDLRENKIHCALPSTWLNQKRWEDAIEIEEKHEPEPEEKKPSFRIRREPDGKVTYIPED